MRVLMFGWEFPPHNSGGLGVACRGLAKALSAEGAEILFVLPRRVALSDDSIRFLFAGVESVRIKSADAALAPYATAHEYAHYRRLLGPGLYAGDLFGEVARYAALVENLIAGETFDIIHAHDWLSFLAGLEAKRISGKPLILHVHLTGFEQAGGESVDERVYAIEKDAMNEADAVIAVSSATRNILISKYSVAPEKVFVVHNGIDPPADAPSPPGEGDRFSFKPQGYNMVLFVGRLTLHKGPDYFLRAAHRVLQYYPKTIFVVAGSGDMEWQLMRLAASLGIAEKVFFVHAWRGEVERLYRAADLVVMPSVSEPFGIVPLESLVNGTPVLISKQSGVSEVLSHALKVDFWDIEEMANKIIAALRYPPLHGQLSRYGRGEALALSWRKAAEKCIRLYRSLMGLRHT